MEGIDALDWVQDRKPVEQIKSGAGMRQHAVWRNINYSVRGFREQYLWRGIKREKN